jgi:hypothetical protein
MTTKERSVGLGLVGIASLVMLSIGMYVGTYNSNNVSQKKVSAQADSGTTLQLVLKENTTVFGKVKSVKGTIIEIVQNYRVEPQFVFTGIAEGKADSDSNSDTTVNQTSLVHVSATTTFTREPNTIPYHFKPTASPTITASSLADIKPGEILQITVNPHPVTALPVNEFEALSISVAHYPKIISGVIDKVDKTKQTFTIRAAANLDISYAKEAILRAQTSTTPIPSSSPVSSISAPMIQAPKLTTIHVTTDTELVEVFGLDIMAKMGQDKSDSTTNNGSATKKPVLIKFSDLDPGDNVTVYTMGEGSFEALLVEASLPTAQPTGGLGIYTPPQSVSPQSGNTVPGSGSAQSGVGKADSAQSSPPNTDPVKISQ